MRGGGFALHTSGNDSPSISVKMLPVRRENSGYSVTNNNPEKLATNVLDSNGHPIGIREGSKRCLLSMVSLRLL
jgi:hypothetical protein